MIIAMKRVSVAEAKNHLPALLHEAEKAPIEILRRGKLVAAIVSREEYERLPRRDWFAAIMKWRSTYAGALGAGGEDWVPPRAKDADGGRGFAWE